MSENIFFLEETERLDNKQFVNNPELVFEGEILNRNEKKDYLDLFMNGILK